MTPARAGRLRAGLEQLRRHYDARFLDTDPLWFPRRFVRADDREVVGLVASALAYGRVKSIASSVSRIVSWLGDHPARFARTFDPARELPKLEGFQHRWSRPEDVACLVHFAGRMIDAKGSVGAFFLDSHEPADIATSLSRFSQRALALDHGGAYRSSRLEPDAGVRFFFTSPATGACKRMNMYLRWMVRRDDGVDLGLWPEIACRDLVIPLDTHIFRIGRHLGWSRRKTPGFRTAVEITEHLAVADPDDPVKYDFALSRMGILENCPRHPGRNDCELCRLKKRIRSRNRVAIDETVLR